MIILTKFEFYNNFDIWYDLYQENGGDPNFCINMFFNFKKSMDWLSYEIDNIQINANVFPTTFFIAHICGSGCPHEFLFTNYLGGGDGNGYGYEDEYNHVTGYGNGYAGGCEAEGIIGVLFDLGNGSY